MHLALTRRLAAAAAVGCSVLSLAQAEKMRVFVGTYTGPKSEGIYAFDFDNETGEAQALGLAAKTSNPSFLALSPDRRFLYAVNEDAQWNGMQGGSVTAFAIPEKGASLKQLNQQSTQGAAPCHLSVAGTGKVVLAANYGGGSVVTLPVRPDGSLGGSAVFIQHTGSSVNPNRQKEPHAHSINVSPDDRYALVADLGVDKVFVYQLDPNLGALIPNNPPALNLTPGSGPRHFAFSPNGKLAFVINEMASTLTSLSFDASRGALSEIQTVSTLPADFKGESSTAQVCVHPNGKFVYGSNRGDDSIVVFSVSPEGKLGWVERVSTQGRTPRNFNIDPSGRFLWAANQSSDSIVVFRINPDTGKLTPVGKPLSVGSPVCVVFDNAK